MTFSEHMEKSSKPFIASTSILAALLIWSIGWMEGMKFFLLPYYLIPIFLATWYLGRPAGAMISVLCAALLWVQDIAFNIANLSPVVLCCNTAFKLLLFLVFNFTLSQLKDSRQNEENLAMLDNLTQISNRRSFYEMAGIEIKRSRRYRHPFTVAYIDIDNLKIINYRHGHTMGDSVLHEVAQAIKGHIRNVDIVARFGGDEFAVLLPETGAEPAQVVFSRLRTVLLELMQKSQWQVTFSFGVVTFMTAPESVEEMMKKASVQMYSAKSGGANMIDQEVYTKSGTV